MSLFDLIKEHKIEPMAACTAGSLDNIALLSIAISLKRIADTLDGTSAGIDIANTMFAGSAQQEK